MKDQKSRQGTVNRLFPFLRWFPLSARGVRADIIAGISVAMILVPQSMGYAKLAGLPVVYGLYAAALPVIIGSMWGSSRYLHTGPVAMLSLLSAASLAPFATAGTDLFIQLSLMLAFMVGVLRLLLGIFRLGVLMNFVSHPVMMGFTNAAALIIGLSLLNTFFNVPKPDTGAFLTDFFGVFGQLTQAHWPTVLFGLATLGLLHLLRRFAPSVPGVLVVVVLGTIVSALVGFERKESVAISQISDVAARDAYSAILDTRARLFIDAEEVAHAMHALSQSDRQSAEAVRLAGEINLLRHDEAMQKARLSDLRIMAFGLKLTRVEDETGEISFRARRDGDAGPVWRLDKMTPDGPVLSGGGQVVGSIPQGLPAFQAPVLNWEVLPALAPAAFVMALIGFMEAMSISRALAARHRDNLDPNQELIGQGLANIVGSFFQSYSVSGSFSRSAVAARSGANSGIFAVISAIAVMITMLFLTPYLYHLPLAVLAAIVMSAVFGLLDLRSIIRTWKISPADGVAGTLTFLTTLYMAPDLAKGVIVGVILAALLFVVSNVRPRTEEQGLSADGSLAGAVSRNLAPIGDTFVVIRFDASLEFMNVAHFGDAVTNALSSSPDVRSVLVLGSSINQIDASGIEKVQSLCEGMRAAGGVLMFSGLKRQVRQRMESSGLTEIIGRENLFPNKHAAVDFLMKQEQALEAGGGASDDAFDPVEVSLDGRLRSG